MRIISSLLGHRTKSEVAKHIMNRMRETTELAALRNYRRASGPADHSE